MNIPPNELLRMLAGGVNPAATSVRVPVSGDQPLDFNAMLEQAFKGKLSTDLPVGTRGLEPPIEAGERERLSVAADRAQQEGIRIALVDLGGRSLRVDVQDRTVIDAPDAQLRAVGDIDGYVRAMNEGAGTIDKPTEPQVFGPARVVRNQSLFEALADVLPRAD